MVLPIAALEKAPLGAVLDCAPGPTRRLYFAYTAAVAEGDMGQEFMNHGSFGGRPLSAGPVLRATSAARVHQVLVNQAAEGPSRTVRPYGKYQPELPPLLWPVIWCVRASCPVKTQARNQSNKQACVCFLDSMLKEIQFI